MSKLLHHFPSWDTMSSIWTSRFSPKREKSSSSGLSPNRKRSNYKDLTDSNVAIREESHDLAPVKSLSGHIHTVNPSEVEEDGMHLEYNVERERNITGNGTEICSKA